MRTPTGFMEWVADNPKDTGVDGEARPTSWAGKCVALVRRAGGFPIANTATTAALARALTVRNGHPMAVLRFDEVPRGWFVYFDGPTKEGHIGMATGDGGFCSATSFIMGAVGVMPISEYAAKRGVTYRGASPFFINLRLAPDPPAPIIPEIRRNTMTTNFVDSSTFDGSGNAVATTVYATGGEFGFPWQEFTRGTLPLASSRYQYALDVHGRFIPLNHTDFLAYKAAYTSGSGASSSGLTTAEHNQLFDIANKGELGQALTSTSSIIINDLTPKIVAIGTKIDNLTLSNG